MESTSITNVRFILFATIVLVLISINGIEGRSLSKRSTPEAQLGNSRRKAREELKRTVIMKAIMSDINGGEYELEESNKASGSSSILPPGFYDDREERKLRQHKNFSLNEYDESMNGLTVEVQTEAPIQVPHRPLNKKSREAVLRVCLDVQRKFKKLYNVHVVCSYGKY